jgi:lysophospholipase L1-like esterase
MVIALCGAVLLLALLFFLFRRSNLVNVASKCIGLLGRTGVLTELLVVLFPPVLFLLFMFSDISLMREALFVTGLLLCYLGLSSVILSLLPSSRSRKALQRIGLCFGSILFSLILMEIVFRLLVPVSVFHPTLDLKPHMEFQIMLDLPGVSRGGIVTTNSWGMRGEEPPDDWDEWFTVITIGGSTTINGYLADGMTWSDVLQENFRDVHPMVWVGNGGIPGHSTRGHKVFMREVISEVRPDAVIFLTGMNDMGQFLRVSEGIRDPGYASLGIRYSIFCASRTVQLLYRLKLIYIDGVEVITVASDPPFVIEELSGSEMDLPENIHDLMQEPDEYRKNIRELIALAREYGATPVFMTQPILYENTEYWRGIRGGTHWFETSRREFSAATFWEMLSTLNGDLLEVCAEEGVLCFDLAVAIDHSCDNFYDMMHFTETGAAAAGEELATFLLEVEFLPQR